MEKKITYTNMKLKPDTSVSTFDFQNNTFKVLNYLPSEDKNDLISITLQESFEDGIFNQIKLDTYFHLNLIFMYVTNLTFTDKQKQDGEKLFDTLKSNGFIDAFLTALPKKEYEMLYDYLNIMIKDLVNYKNSFAGVCSGIIKDLPEQAKAAMEIVENFDPQKYQNVLDFAKAANGGRDIK